MEYAVIASLHSGLIVSCQAGPESALHGPVYMGAMAAEAERGGAVALRIDGPVDIKAARQQTALPILGIYKQKFAGYEPYITPTFDAAQQIANAGASLIAVDGTSRQRPGDLTLDQLVQRIHLELGMPVMADVSTLQEGLQAEQVGADIVATTLAGYTPYSRKAIPHTPDLELLVELVSAISVPVIVEGRVSSPEHLVQCFQLGAYAVCIGSAITSPYAITARFVEAIHARTI